MRGRGRVVIALIFIIFNKEGGHMLFTWPESVGGGGGGEELIEILILNFPTYFSFFPFI